MLCGDKGLSVLSVFTLQGFFKLQASTFNAHWAHLWSRVLSNHNAIYLFKFFVLCVGFMFFVLDSTDSAAFKATPAM